MRRRSLQTAVALLGLALWIMPAHADDDIDPRSYNHGIAAVSDGKDGSWVFFSSSGLIPKGENADGNWIHDVYVGRWRIGDAVLTPHLFIRRPEAQEPVSAAETADGHIMLTFEDGWNTESEVDQRYGVYDNDLRPILAYPRQVSTGGHSGHVAAGGNRFIVAYSNGWIEGGGVDDLGTGYGVYARIYDSSGRQQHYVRLAAHRREWWPLVAASPRDALLVWQAYVKGQTYAELKMALVNLETGQVVKEQTLRDKIDYYTYAVRYLAALDRFLVVGTAQNERGFAYLIDGTGRIAAQIDCMPPVVREEGIAIEGDNAYVPAADSRLLRLHATASSLAVTGIGVSSLAWSTVGSAGVPDGATSLHWFSLDKSGLQEGDFDVRTLSAPSSQDLCR